MTFYANGSPSTAIRLSRHIPTGPTQLAFDPNGLVIAEEWWVGERCITREAMAFIASQKIDHPKTVEILNWSLSEDWQLLLTLTV